ncbi:hypothetical protein [Paenibacillus alkaliterrae]|nr:hypothetical protein [Paenibacillus alkaliterrae]
MRTEGEGRKAVRLNREAKSSGSRQGGRCFALPCSGETVADSH